VPLPSIFTRSSSPEPDDDTPGPRPPDGYPFATWQSEGDYYVPDTLQLEEYGAAVTLSGLRGFYTSGNCDPRPEQVASYHAGGSRYFPISSEGKRPGEAMSSVHLHGEADYPLWLHRHRLSEAVRAAQRALRAEQRAATEAAMVRPCPACKTPVAPHATRSKYVTGYGWATGCVDCVETLAFLVGAELVHRHSALQVLQDHARALVDAEAGPAELDAGDGAA
jgi:hypothetical protein